MKDLVKIAEILDEAAQIAEPVAQFTGESFLSEDEAYAVQALSITRRHTRGERTVGIKMGLTSRAKMLQVGVENVIWGRLTDAMRVEDNGEISYKRYVHPRAEPEIAFILGRSLTGNVSIAEAMMAVDAVCPAIEIIDSRFKNFKFSLGDVVADNCSSSAFVLGNRFSTHMDISNLGMLLEVNGRAIQIGSSAAILGHPARSLVEAAKLAAKWGLTLEAGDIVLAGAATEAFPIETGMHVRAVIQGMGSVAFSVLDQ